MSDAVVSNVEDLITSVRAEAGTEMVPSRQQSESEARDLLDRAAGAMSVEQVKQLAEILNRGSWGGAIKHNRFLPGFSVPLIEQMVADLDNFNDLTATIWRGDEADALNTVDRILRDRSVLPGSGQSYPTVLMYLKDPSKYAVWFDMLDRGLVALSDYMSQSRKEGSDAYLGFCEAAHALASLHGLEPQELDAILSASAKTEVTRRIVAKKRLDAPTIARAAIDFLQELGHNNNKEWFDANRERYERDLRDPLAAVLQYVADEYIVGLDPAINVNVRRDAVMARINKYSQGDPYYTYLWGAFSRDKKQQDLQLYVTVHDDRLEYGFSIGSAAEDARQRLARGLDSIGLDLLSSVLGDDDQLGAFIQDLPDEVPNDDVGLEHFVSAAERGAFSVFKELSPDDALVGSDGLADDIGRTLVRLYPLAALGWGEELEYVEDPSSDTDETVRPEYTLDELVEDTLLPREQLEEWIALLRGKKRAALFYGPPGTGKTWVVEKLARYLAGTNGEHKTVQFHPSFSYEDFIEGLRPEMADGQLGYSIRPGVFQQFCESARGKDGDYVFIIDEINRAELGSVLGEVMMLIEYRNRAIPLPYSQRSFSIPNNVVLLATMNTADRSLALVDFALRRRFHAFRMLPDRDVLQAYLGSDGDLAVRMFDLITKSVSDDDYSPGQTYWMLDDPSTASLEMLWRYELRPYLSEYWFESKARLEKLEKEVLALLAEGA